MAIEHEKTRLSLKDAFEDLFARYDREFDEEDEIDIINLKVVKKGGFLSKSKVAEFGEFYKKRRTTVTDDPDACLSEAEKTSGADTEDSETEEMDEEVLEKFFKRIKKSQAIAKATAHLTAMDHQIHFTPRADMFQPIPLDWKGSFSFDSVLFGLVRDDLKRSREVEWGLVAAENRICTCNKCFDCILIKEMTN